MLAAALLVLPALAAAQVGPYPSRPIRLVVGVPPGGSTDLIARIVGEQLGRQMGEPVLIDNRGGAAGNIGAEIVAKAPPDGYTLFLAPIGTVAINPSLYERLPFDPVKDFAPISQLTSLPMVMLLNPSVDAKTVPEFVAYAKANPGKINFASGGSGTGTHLAGELFKMRTGIEMTHVPYKGGGPSITGLVGNEIQVLFDTIGGSRQLAESGKLRAIAVTSLERAPVMPMVPTVAESGLKDFSAIYWLGIFAPAKTPQPVVDKLYGALKGALDDPAVKAKLIEQGNVALGLPPPEFAKVLDADIARYKAVIDSAKIELQ
jgi:tripartite-type tricarboxylate transporter receptor subunit TctC